MLVAQVLVWVLAQLLPQEQEAGPALIQPLLREAERAWEARDLVPVSCEVFYVKFFSNQLGQLTIIKLLGQNSLF